MAALDERVVALLGQSCLCEERSKAVRRRRATSAAAAAAPQRSSAKAA